MIIVLGCKANDDGTPTPLLMNRLEVAAKKYHELKPEGGNGLPLFIYVTGGAVDRPFAESAVMKKALVETFGVPQDDIVEESKAQDTLDNFENVADLLTERFGVWDGVNVTLVTSEFHVRRASTLCRQSFYFPGRFHVSALNFVGAPDMLEGDALAKRLDWEEKCIQEQMAQLRERQEARARTPSTS